MNERHGFVLSGGGAFGAYEAGVLKALLENGSLEPFVYSGTSVGAYSSAVMCQGGGGREAVARLERIWLEDVAEIPSRVGNGVYRVRFNPIEFFDPRAWMKGPAGPMLELASDSAFFIRLGAQKTLDFIRSSAPLGRRTLDLFDLSAFVTVEPFRRLVAKTIDTAAIRQSAVQLRITATNWDRAGIDIEAAQVFQNRDLTEENGGRIILASAAIPMMFPPEKLDDHWFVDGGLAANTPVGPAIDAGSTVVHVVDLQSDIHPMTIEDLDSTYAALIRSASITISSAIRREIDRVGRRNRTIRMEKLPQAPVAVHRYHPKSPLGVFPQLLDFNRAFLERLIARGYEDARNHDCAQSGCAL